MPIFHKKYRKKSELVSLDMSPSIGASALREGRALAVQRSILPLKKSKAQVRRKNKGWNYNFRGTRGTEYAENRVKCRKIKRVENWQFSSDAPDYTALGGKLVITSQAKLPIMADEKKRKKDKEIKSEAQFKKLLSDMAARKNVKISGRKNLDNLLNDIL